MMENNTYSGNEIYFEVISQNTGYIKAAIEVNTAINSLILGVILGFIAIRVILK